ncbi:MAG: hypothetical protein HYZ72_07550 [Deltaproteobacteria bacterium]|nr:hypothetical protein [Deltaproteobacteria bacterium]
MRRQVAPISLLVVFLALVLPGCAIRRWFASASATEAAPKAVMLPPASSASSATPGSSPPLQWDFAQRTAAEKATAPTPAPLQTARATPVTAPPAPLVRPGSSGRRSLIPGLSDGKGDSDGNPQYVTEEDLLRVVTEFQRVAGKDTYRFPIPKDVTGANVYKATLTRLQDYEAKHSGAYLELLAFTRGRAYEGLREYEKAIAQYQTVSQSKHRLNTEAAKAIETLTHFQEIKQRPLAATTPLAYLQALDDQIAAWQDTGTRSSSPISTSLWRKSMSLRAIRKACNSTLRSLKTWAAQLCVCTPRWRKKTG